jgi:hypothetical protein
MKLRPWSQRIPRHERPGPARTQAGRGLVHPLRGRRVAHRIGLVEDVNQAIEQQAGDDQVGEVGHQGPADRVRRAPPDPAVEQLRGPAVQAANTAPDQQDEAERQDRDERRGHDKQDAVIRHPHQLADLILPVLPEPEGNNEQDSRADKEGRPGPAPRTPGVPIGESTPDPRGKDPEPVADGRGDATDQALDDTAPREQRRRERKARQNERTPAAGERDIKKLPGFPGLRRRRRAFRRGHSWRGFGRPGRLTGPSRISSTPARRIRTLTRRRTDRRPRQVTRHGHLLSSGTRPVPGLGSRLVHACCQCAWRLIRCHRPPGGDQVRAISYRGSGDRFGWISEAFLFPHSRCIMTCFQSCSRRWPPNSSSRWHWRCEGNVG